jgi:hypothetical protein
MKCITTKAHGILDYLFGIILIVSPWLWNETATGLNSLLPILTGIVILSTSIATDYEPSVLRIIPMPAHLWVDFLLGVFMAASPWIFGFESQVQTPHLIIGAYLILVSLVTQTKPAKRKDSNLI